MKIITGRWTEKELDGLLAESSKIAGAGARIAFLSHLFLGNDYEESALQGSQETSEELVINLAALDCFTFIDYIEAMRLSRSYAAFVSNLGKIRYRQGRISFRGRNHFFTDWREFNADRVEDVTEKVGAGYASRVLKVLNEKEDGSAWVPGIAAVKREITYISSPLPKGALEGIMTGDYAGVYSTAAGLDVSHVGIAVRNGRLIFRHASSKHEKVVDEDLQEYFSGKPGLIILRSK